MKATLIQPLMLKWQVCRPWHSPVFLGPALRGMLGRNLQELSKQAPLSDAYAAVFEGSTAGTLNLPPQFVLQPPAPASMASLRPGEHFTCGQILFGTAALHLPAVFQAWQRAQLESSPGSIELESITLCDIEGQAVQHWRPDFEVPAPCLQQLPAAGEPPQSIQLRFLTPLYMREKGLNIRPDLLRPEHLVMGALRRSRLLLPEWYEQTFANRLPAQVLQAWASSLTLRHELEWFTQKRWSHRQNKEIPVAGLLGTAQLDGNLEPFWPALAILPVIGLGKLCNFGLGHVEISKTNTSL